MGLEPKEYAIYAVGRDLRETGFLELAIARLASQFSRIDVWVPAETASVYVTELAHICEANVRTYDASIQGTLAVLRLAILTLWDEGDCPSQLLLTGSCVFGPVVRDGQLEGVKLPCDADVLAPYWHGCDQDTRLLASKVSGNLPALDFTLLGSSVLQNPDFVSFWRNMVLGEDTWQAQIGGVFPFGKWLLDHGYRIAYPMSQDVLGSAEPRYQEPGQALAHGAPCISSDAFHLDPLLHDLHAIDLRNALDQLRLMDPDLYDKVVAYCLRHLKLRDFCTLADQYEIISPHVSNPSSTAESDHPYAVFIHAFYAEMMPEFWGHIQNLSGCPYLFLTTASAQNAEQISDFLTARDWPKDRYEVRVVEQNRGRDMSSLFITWRDIALSGKFDIALRLHSKKTPQVPKQVGVSFKAHLFDNLLASPSYTRNILNLMSEQPDVGVVMPPIVHVGFGTLGHSWYNNKEPLQKIAAEIGLSVPIDDFTPVACYGTMFWFRISALRKMFEHQWRWQDYNAEPHHIDGGLAHVQERLIAYTAQDSGHRVMQVMSPAQAARSYGRLEYKTQLYAAQFASNNVMDHKIVMDVKGRSWRKTLYSRLRLTYGRMLQRHPASRLWLRPIKIFIVSLLVQKYETE